MMEYIARRGHQRRQVLTRFRHTALAARCARYISPQACESRLRSSAGCKEAQRASNCGDSANYDDSGLNSFRRHSGHRAKRQLRTHPLANRRREPLSMTGSGTAARAPFPLIGKHSHASICPRDISPLVHDLCLRPDTAAAATNPCCERPPLLRRGDAAQQQSVQQSDRARRTSCCLGSALLERTDGAGATTALGPKGVPSEGSSKRSAPN